MLAPSYIAAVTEPQTQPIAEPAASQFNRPWAYATALLAGVASTLLGVGGGVIMVPLLSSFANVPIKRAASASLAIISIVAFVGVIAQELSAPGDMLFDAAAMLAITALLGAYIGRWLNRVLPELAFRLIFALLLVFSAIRLAGLLPIASAHMEYGVDGAHLPAVAALLAIGLFAGVTTSLFGVGGGIVVVPLLAMAFDRFSGEGFKSATATSLVMILPVSLFGTWLHWRAKNIDASLVKAMSPLAAIAAIGGVFLKLVTPVDALKWIFAGLMVFAAIQIAWLAIKSRKRGATAA
ncbi:hypothetical protein GPROT1_03521 [Gammaproteobacteria bacterium]|nr:hypothetical protein GPROT1_03521 [Gammaproteobacteria bacterium]